MRKILVTAILIIACISVHATDEIIKLPTHNLAGIKNSVAQTYAKRKSTRVYADKDLSKIDLSNLLWAGNGYNRLKEQKRTAPSAMNRQEIEEYVMTKDGIYLYNATNESLIRKVKGDYRELIAGGQKYAATAPVIVLLNAKLSKFGDTTKTHIQYVGAVDVGIVTENICLFCAAANLAVVPRATMDITALKKLLNLTDTDLLIMNLPIGYYVNK